MCVETSQPRRCVPPSRVFGVNPNAEDDLTPRVESFYHLSSTKARSQSMSFTPLGRQSSHNAARSRAGPGKRGTESGKWNLVCVCVGDVMMSKIE